MAGGLALLLAAAGVAEALGWPFLAAPLQTALSRALDRPVDFDGAVPAAAPTAAPTVSAAASASASASAVPTRPATATATATAAATSAAGGVRVHLLGGLEVQAQRIEIAAPAWSQRAPTLVAEEARLQLRYGDLWRAAWGEPVRVRRIEARRLQVELERRADGRASWQFGPAPVAGAPPAPLPVIEELRIAEGVLRLHDELSDSDIDARFALSEGGPGQAVGADRVTSVTAGPASPASVTPDGAPSGRPWPGVGLRADATGRYRALPLSLSLRTVGVLPWVVEDAARQAVPLTIDGSIGRARLHFDGAVRDLRHLAGLGGQLTLSGPSLAAVGDVVGVTLPTTAAFTLRGQLRKDGAVWQVRVDRAQVGRSLLNAELRYEPRGASAPLLSGRLGGSRLLLADLGPSIGLPSQPVDETAPAAPGRVLPDRAFDLPALRAMDADVQVAFDQLDLGTPRLQALAPLRTHLLLKDGVLDLRDIDARTADGRLQGLLSLDGREAAAVWRTDLRWSEVRLEQWLRQVRSTGAPPYLTGRLDGRARLTGRGRSTAQILATLEGELFGRVRGGTLSHLLVEGAGLDIAQGLGVFLRGDDALPMDCAVADLQVRRGVARPRAMVVDTRDSVIWVDGQVSLADESLDLRAVVAPRDFSPLALRTPVKLQGSLGAPRVSLEAGPLAGKLVAAALLALVNPIAALLPLIDPGSEAAPGPVTGNCRRLAQQAAQRPRP